MLFGFLKGLSSKFQQFMLTLINKLTNLYMLLEY